MFLFVFHSVGESLGSYPNGDCLPFWVYIAYVGTSELNWSIFYLDTGVLVLNWPLHCLRLHSRGPIITMETRILSILRTNFRMLRLEIDPFFFPLSSWSYDKSQSTVEKTVVQSVKSSVWSGSIGILWDGGIVEEEKIWPRYVLNFLSIIVRIPEEDGGIHRARE